MVSRAGAILSLFLFILLFWGKCSSVRVDTSCTKFETYVINEYKMTPLDFTKDDWFSHIHYSPRRKSKMGFRTKRVYNCCDPGFKYQGFPIYSCQPICNIPCLVGSYCAEPGQCKCIDGYRISALGVCVPIQQTTTVPTTKTTTEVKIPCNGSCSTNEECSATEFGVCVCRVGFERANINATCVPKCELNCGTTVEAIVQLPCNGSCGTNEKCSAKDDICLCSEGYERSNSTCVLKCESNCGTTVPAIVQPPCNGSCGTNEECADSGCVCKVGYVRSNSTCEPKCETPCHNANCVAPNVCDCWPNYERINTSSCHMPCSKRSCIYGECNQNGVCECADGFLNNGTACVWAGDAILEEPDDCDCWAKFVWQKNKTEISALPCQELCDGDDSIEVASSECINYKECQCYEGFLVCHAQMYKCYAEEMTSVTATSTVTYNHVEMVAQSANSPTIIVIIIIIVLLVFLAALIVWNKRHSWCNRWNNMGSGHTRLL